MIVTPSKQHLVDNGGRRPKTSHGRLQKVHSLQETDLEDVRVPPIPLYFVPSTQSLILGTRKRLQSLRGAMFSRTSQHRNKRVVRANRRAKSAMSNTSEFSDDDTLQSVTTETEWSWLDEKFDYDRDSDEEQENRVKVSEHSVEVYKKICEKYREVPSRCVLSSLRSCNRQLAVRNRHLGPKGAKALAVALVVNCTLEVVDLTGNDIGSEGTNYLCQALTENICISELILTDNSLQSAGIKCLADTVKNREGLNVLNISGNSLEEYDAIHIADIIRGKCLVKELYASHNALREKGGQIIANALADNNSLQILDLSWNHLRRKGAVAIAECLKSNVALKRLNVAWNGFHMEGCGALRRSLPGNKTLIELDVSSNRINLECLQELLKGLRQNRMISLIKLSHNFLSTDGLDLILNTIKTTPDWSIKEIDISTEMVDMGFVMRYEEIHAQHPVFIKYGVVRPGAVKPDQNRDDSTAFLNDDPMIVLMEYMRLQNLRLLDLFTSLDADGSKSLSREEFRCGLLNSNIPLSSEALDHLITSLDQDNDGEVDFNELLDGLKAHKRKVHKLQKKQKHLKFEETDIGRVSLKIKALLQFRMLFHKMSLAKTNVEKEAMENTLQEYTDKFSDLGMMKKDMLQAGMDRARQAALQRQEVKTSVRKNVSVFSTLNKALDKSKKDGNKSGELVAKKLTNRGGESPGRGVKKSQTVMKMRRVASAPPKKNTS